MEAHHGGQMPDLTTSLYSQFAHPIVHPLHKDIAAISPMPGDTNYLAVVGNDLSRVLEVGPQGITAEIPLKPTTSSHAFNRFTQVCWGSINAQSRVIAATASGSIYAWDPFSTPAKQVFYKREGCRINQIVSRPQEPHQFLTVASDGSIKLWDMRDNHRASLIVRRKAIIYSNAIFNPVDNRDCVVAEEDGSINQLDIRKKAFVARVFAHTQGVKSMHWNPEGRWLATAGNDKLIMVWDMNEPGFKGVRKTIHTQGNLKSVRWRPGHPEELASSHTLNDGRVYLWNINRPYLPRAYVYCPVPVVDFTFRDESVVWATCEQGNFRQLDFHAGTIVEDLFPRNRVCWSPRGQLAFTTSRHRIRNPVEEGLACLAAQPQSWPSVSHRRLLSIESNGSVGNMGSGNTAVKGWPGLAPSTLSTSDALSTGSSGTQNRGRNSGVAPHIASLVNGNFATNAGTIEALAMTQSMLSAASPPRPLVGGLPDSSVSRLTSRPSSTRASHGSPVVPPNSFVNDPYSSHRSTLGHHRGISHSSLYSGNSPSSLGELNQHGMSQDAQRIHTAQEVEVQELMRGSTLISQGIHALTCASPPLPTQDMGLCTLTATNYHFDPDAFAFLAQNYREDSTTPLLCCQNNANAALQVGNYRACSTWHILAMVFQSAQWLPTNQEIQKRLAAEHQIHMATQPWSANMPPAFPAYAAQYRPNRVPYYPPDFLMRQEALSGVEGNQPPYWVTPPPHYSNMPPYLRLNHIYSLSGKNGSIRSTQNAARSSHAATRMVQQDSVPNPMNSSSDAEHDDRASQNVYFSPQPFDPIPEQPSENEDSKPDPRSDVVTADHSPKAPSLSKFGAPPITDWTKPFNTGETSSAGVPVENTMAPGNQTIGVGKSSPLGDGVKLLQQIIEFYAQQGDVQFCVTLFFVFRQFLQPVVDHRRVAHWCTEYMELLRRFKLHAVATQIGNRSAFTFLKMPTTKHSEIATSCNFCNEPLPYSDHGYWACLACQHLTSQCALCHLPAKGQVIWCRGCGHGGHAKHLIEWYRKHSTCPTGCGHECTAITVEQ
ncbi:SEA (Seh1-associated) complex subunit [Dispira parvispora]|uniref:SEA (Seh1-associated) complex subunit n=1 Tax=Dispira parvispora TaxID=1520584 RepID=A0A9W8ARC1_9FUNG|nr:SEA (Seh1-associated) complex subunit [Dispira parvispora]